MVINGQRRIRIAVKPLAAFLRRMEAMLGLPAEAVTVRLVSDHAMARWNRLYRGKRGPTDVLSFPVDGRGRKLWRGKAVPKKRNRARIPNHYLGDIAISPATALRNARRFGRTFQTELRALIVHGVLHLAGYDHETDRGEMTRLERRLLLRLDLR